jgi:CDP-diacylglycerol--glycerol-3-phosphate 3-phosphatidyltransferase
MNETQPSEVGSGPSPRFWTVPNVLTVIRLVGSPFFIVAALAGSQEACLTLFAVLWLTDWLDGKLAKWLDQGSPFGARLDSIADATFYAAILIAAAILKWEMIGREALWIIVGISSYAVSAAAGLYRFGRLPSYHTRMAKTTWFLAGVAVVAVFADWSVWPLRIAAISVVITNIEAVLIAFVLPEWRADVPSLYHALRIKADASTPPDRTHTHTS